MPDLLVALGLVLAIEGTLYAIAPRTMKRMMQSVLRIEEQVLRIGGVVALGLGVLIVWIVRR